MQEEYKPIKLIRSFFFVPILTLLIGTVLLSFPAFADDPSIVDDINITVPVSCSLSGTGMDTHITELHNTESDSSIGESTITAYCNDLNGFSIYAVGFTNNEYGNNYLIDSNLPSTTNIATGTATSGNTSQWSMKLSPITNTNPAPTYPIIITGTTEDTDKTPTTLNYTSFQPVPNEYALVAKRKAATDVGTNAEGSSFKTTYQAYVSPTQNAGTYEGQVKYTLIHPYQNIDSSRPNQYYVVHSGTGEIEVLPLSDDGDLTAKVADGFIYGGYYKSYGGVDSDAVNSLIAQYENGEVDDLTISSFKTYTAENMGELRNAWNIQDAYTEYGNAVGVEKERVYYLKEVPNTYLKNSTYRTFNMNSRILTDYYLLSAIDDLNYKKIGFIARKPQGSEELEAKAFNSLSYKTAYVDDTITTSNIAGYNEYGYVMMSPYTDLSYPEPGGDIERVFYNYYVTPDGMNVLGATRRYTKIEDSDSDSIIKIEEVEEKVYTYSKQPEVYSGETRTPPLILGE